MDAKLFRYNKQVLINLIWVVTIFALIYVGFKYVIPFFLPFVVGMIIAGINVPFVRIFEKLFKLRRRLAVFLSMFLTITLLAVIVFFGVINIYDELVSLQSNISSYYQSSKIGLEEYYQRALNYYHKLPPNISNSIDESIKSFEVASKRALESTIKWMMGMISSIPNMIIFTIISLLSAFFFSADGDEIGNFVRKQLPKAMHRNLHGFKADALKAFWGYIKAVLILMCITGIEVSLGLLIMKFLGYQVNYAILMGFIVGVSEAIPIFGTGAVMVPWILWNLVIGSVPMGIGLIIIFVIGIVLRQLLEPKIVGDTLGLHPLATLLAMYIGLAIFGFIGLFVGPFSLIILKSLNKSGIIKVWKE